MNTKPQTTTRRQFLSQCLGTTAAVNLTTWFSKSSLYFTNKAGDKVWQFPYNMSENFAEPVLLKR